MTDRPDYHMNPEDFRRWGHAVVDWIAAYQQRVESLPVLSPVEPGQIRASLPADPPEQGEDFAAILGDVEEKILPGITHWQSPNFFAYFPANASGPSIIGDLISSGLGVQGMLWSTSPACTELETHVLDWLAELLALPGCFRSSGPGGGVIQDSASSATLCALLAARERSTAGESNRAGVREPLLAYASDQAHSSVDKAVRIAGIGQDNLRKIPHDGDFAMDPRALAQFISADRKAGGKPCFVVATLGTTSSCAVDPLPEIVGLENRTTGMTVPLENINGDDSANPDDPFFVCGSSRCEYELRTRDLDRGSYNLCGSSRVAGFPV